MTDEARFEKARRDAEEVRRRFEDHDPSTFQHSVRVANWAVLLAGQVPGVSPNRLRRLGVTALLHDFGKTFLDPELLHKVEPLDAADREKIEQHPVLGADNLPVSREFVDPEGIRWHHKHFDGGGYPDGPLKGIELPLEARLIAIADVFDALTSVRPYHGRSEPYTPADALELMNDMAGTELDPSLVGLFATVYGLECERVGGEAGARTLQVLSVIGQEVERARDLLMAEIGPFNPKDPLEGRKPDDRLVDRLVTGLVRASIDSQAARNIARYVLRLSLDETFDSSELAGPPRKATTPPGGFSHHMEVILTLKRLPARSKYMSVVVFMGQLWLCVGERKGDTYEVRLAR